jgi:hypothetical protein
MLKAESDVYSAALGKAAVAAASYSNYQAIVVLDKTPTFKVTGKVVLGRYDENTKPTTSVTGAKLDPTGQAKIALTAGGVESILGGQFNFVEDGKTIH